MSRSYKRAATINPANIKSFANRVAIEIDAMRGKICDHLRPDDFHMVEGKPNFKLHKANTALYRAHVALLDAQAELLK
jgi:hypothetical protein